jgi:hypothetical protein
MDVDMEGAAKILTDVEVRALPPDVREEGQRIVRELEIELREWELMGATVKRSPWLCTYSGMQADLGVFHVRTACTSMVYFGVSGTGKRDRYFVWGYRESRAIGCTGHSNLEEALERVRTTVKQWM